MKHDEQHFLNELDKRLWTAADRLRSNLDAAVYKHVVLGLIFRLEKTFCQDVPLTVCDPDCSRLIHADCNRHDMSPLP